MTLVEKVARALYHEDHIVPWDGIKDLKLRQARDAIAAMREPTAEMLRACESAAFGYPLDFKGHWKAMIDAALVEKM